MNTAFSDKTLTDLQWPELAAFWGEFCVNPAAAEKIRGMAFALTREEASRRMDCVQSIRDGLRLGISLAVPELPDCRDHLVRLERGGALSALAFRDIYRVLMAVRDLLRAEQALGSPAFSSLLNGLDALTHLRVLLEETVDEEGAVKAGASSVLYGLRARRTYLYQDLTTRMERMLNRRDLQEYLQDKYITVREGRFVLPVKSSFRHQVRGTIHGASQSGQTVFVEPQEFIESNNRLREIDVDIEIEEYRILSELAVHAAHEVDSLARDIDILLTADAWIAAARMAERLDANRFDFSDEDLHLVHARHPLLVRSGVSVVPNTVMLSGGHIMIVTGPNAGGKTVLIKTVGILALMARMGLPLPVGAGSRCPFFGDVHTLIGDDQSIASHVSTFSAQILHLKEILARARSGHLLLLDELATGTDPQQGAFLAQAVLEHIVQAGIAALVTTHFSALKTLALLDSRFINVSVGGSALRPDYRLVPGQPGTSEGIEVAGQLGLAESIIRRARQLASQGDTRVDSLLAEISTIRARMLEEEARLREREAELERRMEDARRLEERFQKQLAQLRKDAMDDSLRELSRCRLVLSRLREKAEKGGIQAAQMEMALEKAARVMDEQERQMAGPAPDFAKLVPGDRVRSRKLRHEVEVIAVDYKKQKIQGRVGNLISSLDFGDLESIGKSDSASKKDAKGGGIRESGKESTGKSKSSVEREGDAGVPDPMNGENAEPYLPPSNTLDVRGKRVEAAIAELERHLDRMFRENQPGFHVIHGYGSGILSAAIREHLSQSTYVASFRPGRPDEGGDGVTAIFLL